ncbi:WYL domain-containing protein [Caulobacter segnis]|uniref:helix-turn-helix transcriptional regulator n=1 Tax=Caulobacter segnis TaxID=88688 RepID=UPI00240EA654|nr:WYL domain-containing protein [Caulobacter segnis]MDG2522978.1 WYL domain-containing protein [Caulobacter segnis]
MRHDKAALLLDLARRLAGSAEGLTLDEMAEGLGVGRRTAERMRDAVWAVFPQMEAVEDPPTKRFRIPSGLDSLFQAPTADEMVALRTAADSLKVSGGTARAEALYSLERKLLAAMRAQARRRLAPDMEALVQAETIAVHAGARPMEDAAVLSAIRTAITGLTALRFKYDGGSKPGREREVTPFGVMFGRSNYLVAGEGKSPEPRTWRLDKIRDVEVMPWHAAPPEGFSLQAFADQSFGIYQGAVEDVVLHITPEGAEDALRWRFHANQSVEKQADGSVIVAFRASGMLELAWHLFTWQDKVRVVSPPALKTMLVQELEKALAAHRA